MAKWVWARDADAEARFIAKQVKEGRNGGKANSNEVQAIKGAKGGKAKGAANFNKRVAAEALRMDGYTQLQVAGKLGLTKQLCHDGKDFEL